MFNNQRSLLCLKSLSPLEEAQNVAPSLFLQKYFFFFFFFFFLCQNAVQVEFFCFAFLKG